MKLLVSCALVFASFGYAYLGISIIKDDFHSPLRIKYSLTGYILALWSFCFCVMTAAEQPQLRFIFWAIGLCAAVLFFPTWMLFFSELTQDKSKRKTGLIATMYVLAVSTSLWCVLSGDVSYRSTSAGWQFLYKPTAPFLALFGFLCAAASVLVFDAFRWNKTAKLKRLKKDAHLFIIILGATAPLIILFDYVIPIFSGRSIVPISSVITIFSSLPLYFTMRSHQTFSPTAGHVSELLFSSIAFPILLTDRENTVKLANPIAMRIWPEALIEQRIESLIQVKGHAPDSSLFDSDFSGVNVTLSGDGQSATFELLQRITSDEFGDVVSKTLVFNDITNLQYKDRDRKSVV